MHVWVQSECMHVDPQFCLLVSLSQVTQCCAVDVLCALSILVVMSLTASSCCVLSCMNLTGAVAGGLIWPCCGIFLAKSVTLRLLLCSCVVVRLLCRAGCCQLIRRDVVSCCGMLSVVTHAMVSALRARGMGGGLFLPAWQCLLLEHVKILSSSIFLVLCRDL